MASMRTFIQLGSIVITDMLFVYNKLPLWPHPAFHLTVSCRQKFGPPNNCFSLRLLISCFSVLQAPGSESGSSDTTSCSSISNLPHHNEPVIRPLSAHGMQQAPGQSAPSHHSIPQQMMPPHGIPTTHGSSPAVSTVQVPHPQQQMLPMPSNMSGSNNGPAQQMRSPQSQSPMFYSSSNKV